MVSLQRKARIAGWIYLSMVLTAPFSLLYVPSQIVVRGDAAATAGNILAHQTLFRLGIVGALATAVIFLFTALALRDLLRDVSPLLAAQMVALVMVSVPISFLNELNNLAALTLLSGADHFSAFSPEQLRAGVMLFLRLYSHGHSLGAIFWGLWLFPFGLLVYRSGFLPRILGLWLMVNCFGYLAISFSALFLPDYRAAVSLAVMPALLGELAILLWLLIKGVKEPALPGPAPARAIAR